MLERWFKLAELRTDVRTEILAGATTFMTMAYIIVVQPTVLQAAGMDFGAVVVATCLSSALATVLMAFLANYPIAVAPAMGHNFFFAYTVILGMKVSWEIALGAVFIAGSLFIVLSLFGLREAIIHAVPESLQHAIAVGIGLLIAMVGLQWSGIVMDSPGTLVGLGDLRGPPVLLAIFGVGTVSLLMVLKVKGAILWGMGASTLVGLVSGLLQYQGLVSPPPSLAPVFLRLDLRDVHAGDLFQVVDGLERALGVAVLDDLRGRLRDHAVRRQLVRLVYDGALAELRAPEFAVVE